MTLRFRPLHDALGLEVEGLDLAGAIDAAAQTHLREAFLSRHLLLVRGQQVSAADQLRFLQVFGPISRAGANMRHGGEVMRISNAHADGAFPNGELLFHSDHVYFERPLKGISLYAEAVPEQGGETLFANAILAWESLPTKLRARVGGLRADNVYDYASKRGDRRFSRGEIGGDAPNWVHPIAWRHPEAGPCCWLTA